ncbi:UNVERIFIED_CONTAM: hypothetical protein Slati_2159100 [Sesamum latifolium]|uniref:Uncharacterized protein n=1 Tax=Sesamum latifolium TaxID=2727402 RepID=A0AAW2WQT8_9LAMI
MRKNLGEDPSEATSKRSGSNPPSYVGGRGGAYAKWPVASWMSPRKRRDVTRRRKIPPRRNRPVHKEDQVLPGTQGSQPLGSAWVACCLRQSDIYQLV